MGNEIFRMSSRDIDRYDIVKRLIRGNLNGSEAAAQLGLSIRHTKRLKAAVRSAGARALVHGNRGQPSHNRVSVAERTRIVSLVRARYLDFTPTFAAEKLRELHGLDHVPKTIEAIMIAADVWKQAPVRRKEQHRAWRERKANFGEMQQFDGSYHLWFEDRAPETCLLAAIDDAAGRITHAKFDESEGLVPVATFWEEYILHHGKPISLYVDKFSTYHMNNGLAVENSDTKTQFERAMETDLRITVITAHSPQAKGRIERLFETLQDRLVKELRLKKIADLETANKFLVEEFIPDFNKRFAVLPRAKANVHRPLTKTEAKNLSALLCRHSERTVRNDFTVSYQNQWYQLLPEQPVTVRKQDVVIVEERRDRTTHLRLRGKYLAYRVLPARPMKANQTKQPWVLPATGAPTRPPANHPWRLQFQAAALQSQLAKV